MKTRALIAGFVILGIIEIALSATSLHAQKLDIMPPTTRPAIVPDQDQHRGTEKSRVARPGLNEPHFISRFSVKTDTGQLGIAGWTSANPTVPPGPSLSGGDGAGSVAFGLAAEWGARPTSQKHLLR
jgi:hypothetical protein